MNTLDSRISEALRAQADQLTERELTPMSPPLGPEPRTGWSMPILAAAAVVLLATGGTVAVRAATGSGHKPSAPPAGPVGSGPAPTSAPPSTEPLPSTVAPTPAGSGVASPTGTARPTPTPTGLPAGYLALWPLDETGQNRGGLPAGTDAAGTALAFTRQYLGFTEIDTVTSSRFDEQGAHIGVGYRDPAGQLRTAAVLHLLQDGPAGGSRWEVVGSGDTTLTLEQPSYGSAVSSPMTVGGRITGVDENIRVTVRSLTRGVVGSAPGLPAGGQSTPWHTGVSFTGTGVLTIVAVTGGHLQAVERFAIQGVRA
jgi:hypothetical protein